MKTNSVACPEQEENLVLLYYGDLAGVERDNLRHHLTDCAGCGNFFQDLGELLPLTRKSDKPPAIFWTDYNRELRHQLDDLALTPTWPQRLTAFFELRPVPIIIVTAMIVLAITFTLGRGLWPTNDPARHQTLLLEVMPVAENLEFFRTMDVLDELELLELMENQGSAA
jgi:hypothetical protein